MIILKGINVKDIYLYFYDKDFSIALFTMLQTIPLYVKLLLVPTTFIYNYNGYIPYTGTINLPVIISILVILILCISIKVFLKRASLVSYAIIFFFISLLPVMNIIPTANLAAERFLYISSISIILVIVSVLLTIRNNWKSIYIYSVLGVIICIFGILTVSRSSDWKNNNTLFLSAKNKPGTVLYTNLGNIYYRKNELNLAEQCYLKALDIRKELPLPYSGLAKVMMDEGKSDSAFFI